MADEAPDEQRFTAMYDAYRQRVWAYAVSRAGRRLADEVVSDTFTVAWRRLADVPDPALRVRLHRARRRLVRAVEERTDAGERTEPDGAGAAERPQVGIIKEELS